MELVIFKKSYSAYVMNILDHDNIIIHNFWHICHMMFVKHPDQRYS